MIRASFYPLQKQVHWLSGGADPPSFPFPTYLTKETNNKARRAEENFHFLTRLGFGIDAPYEATVQISLQIIVQTHR